MLGHDFGLHIEKVCIDRAPCDLTLWRSHKTQLANRQPAFRFFRRDDGHWGPERAAGNWTRGIQVACPCNRVEDWAGFIVGEVLKLHFVLFFGEELSGRRVAGKGRVKPLPCLCRAPQNAFANAGFGRSKPFSQPVRVKCRYREDADAALMAAGFAGHPVTRTGVSISQCGVGNLDEFRIDGHTESLSRPASGCEAGQSHQVMAQMRDVVLDDEAKGKVLIFEVPDVRERCAVGVLDHMPEVAIQAKPQ